MTMVFKYQTESATLWCHICRCDTVHTREARKPKLLWTCRGDSHPHLTRQQQEDGVVLPGPSTEDKLKRDAQLSARAVITTT